MSEILDLPEVRARLTRMPVEDYQQLTELGLLDKHTILIRGFLIDKMSKSPLHQSIAKYLYDQFSSTAPTGYSVRQDGPIVLADSVPEPDVSVVRGDDRDFRHRHPVTAELVIEVAVTSVREDRELAALYAESGVTEYWIVMAREQKVEVYRRPENGVYLEIRAYAVEEELESASVPGLRIRISDLFQ